MVHSLKRKIVKLNIDGNVYYHLIIISWKFSQMSPCEFFNEWNELDLNKSILLYKQKHALMWTFSYKLFLLIILIKRKNRRKSVNSHKPAILILYIDSFVNTRYSWQEHSLSLHNFLKLLYKLNRSRKYGKETNDRLIIFQVKQTTYF